MDKVEVPESIWINVHEGHHQRYISVYSVPATEHIEYVPASRLAEAVALLSVVELVSSFLVSLHRQWISDSDSVVRDAAKSYQGTVEELFSSVRKLNAFQLGQLRKLIAHYRASLMNIVEYAPSEREEWYAGAVWNLTEDVNSYLRQSPHHLTGGSHE